MRFTVYAIVSISLLLYSFSCSSEVQNNKHENDKQEALTQVKSDTVKYSKEFIIDAHKYCNADKKEMLLSDSCGCFYCGKVYPTKEITQWTEPTGKLGANAICPHCGIDAVIGSKSGIPINDPDFLKAMYDYWF